MGGQRSFVRYLFPDLEADDTDVRRSQPFGLRRSLRVHLWPQIPWSAQLRPPEACREYDTVPALALFHERLRAPHLARLAAVSRAHRAGAHAADVRREEHDVRGGPQTWALFDGGRAVPRPDVDE